MSIGENKEIDRSSQASFDRARKEGWRIVVPTAFELLIDIDSDTAFQHFEDAYAVARDLGMVSGYSAHPSKSGGERRHVTVRVPLKITPLERIALQAILGSDWKREIFSLERLRNGDAVPTLFFETLTEEQQKIVNEPTISNEEVY